MSLIDALYEEIAYYVASTCPPVERPNCCVKPGCRTPAPGDEIFCVRHGEERTDWTRP